jgi:hypothetical protein
MNFFTEKPSKARFSPIPATPDPTAAENGRRWFSLNAHPSVPWTVNTRCRAYVISDFVHPTFVVVVVVVVPVLFLHFPSACDTKLC